MLLEVIPKTGDGMSTFITVAFGDHNRMFDDFFRCPTL